MACAGAGAAGRAGRAVEQGGEAWWGRAAEGSGRRSGAGRVEREGAERAGRREREREGEEKEKEKGNEKKKRERKEKGGERNKERKRERTSASALIAAAVGHAWCRPRATRRPRANRGGTAEYLGVGSMGNREIRRHREDSGRLGLGFQGGISSSTTKQNFSA